MDIFENYDKVKDSRKKKELWRTQSIIDIVNLTKDPECEQFFESALILIMSLMSDEFIDPTMCESKNFNNLNNHEREIGISILIEEFN